jgi:hypothetical protein
MRLIANAAAIDVRIRIRKIKAAISSSPQVIGLSNELHIPKLPPPQRAMVAISESRTMGNARWRDPS